MLSRRYKERPDCQLILSEKSLWALSLDELEGHLKIQDIENLEDKYNSSFIYKIIIAKLIENCIEELNVNFARDEFFEKEFISWQGNFLGKGSYGGVYEVKKRNEDKVYAIKKIEIDIRHLKQFLKELKTSTIITELRNERLVQYYDVWLENTNFYIQMELCDKKRLKDFIEETYKDSNLYTYTTSSLTLLGYYITSKIFAEILEGVNYLHKLNIIHRDLKPENILFKLDTEGKSFVKIADFGLVAIHKNPDKALFGGHKFAESSHTAGIGTVRYAPPEKYSGRKYDTTADIYSLGVIAEELFFRDINRFVLKMNLYLNLNVSYTLIFKT